MPTADNRIITDPYIVVAIMKPGQGDTIAESHLLYRQAHARAYLLAQEDRVLAVTMIDMDGAPTPVVTFYSGDLRLRPP